MPLVQVASVGGGVVVVSVDLDATGTIVGIEAANSAAGAVEFRVTRAGFDLASGLIPVGVTTRAVPKNRRFVWDATEDVQVSITARWP